MSPSILKALFIMFFMLSFFLVTQPKSLLRASGSVFGKVAKKENDLDKNDIKIL